MAASPVRTPGFGWSLHAEWTKLRTVRGWVAGLAVAALVTVLLGALAAASSRTTCGGGPRALPCPAPPAGPSGAAVEDGFYLAHRALTGDGAITARLTSMTGVIVYPPPDHDTIVSGLVPWAKAGIMIKESTRQGSAYAALMLTGGHGVRMQHDFTEDTPGRPGGVTAGSPRWLRLTRTGDTLTGHESPDGARWTEVGTARLPGLPRTVRVALFVASPGDLTVKPGVLGAAATSRFTQTTAVFDNVTLRGRTTTPWTARNIGPEDRRLDHLPAFKESRGTVTLTGSGDIAPLLTGQKIENTLPGLLLALTALIVLATAYITAEYRHGLIRTTLLATPGRRGCLLAAKAAVLAAVTFVTTGAASAATVLLGTRLLRAGGNHVLPVSLLTGLRVVLGAAALLALAAVLVLSLGAVLRRAVLAVTVGIAVLVVPYVLATTSVLPQAASEWLLRLTPAAGFAILQSIPAYPQVIAYYAPVAGFHPLPPWAGLTVLSAYTALAFTLGVIRLRRSAA
ncbi:DUF1349 domain-containing protein [Sphaerisporangium aureirubrum]|uniref:DUF1349 domain-containing protein n=1 Tax=Sphaerisporangium aureirubrum TaxID=1544736 RepID=A0ABW1NH95_9ACTN